MVWNQRGDFIVLDPNPDPHLSNLVDPDKINADPHHWRFRSLSIYTCDGQEKDYFHLILREPCFRPIWHLAIPNTGRSIYTRCQNWNLTGQSICPFSITGSFHKDMIVNYCTIKFDKDIAEPGMMPLIMQRMEHIHIVSNHYHHA